MKNFLNTFEIRQLFKVFRESGAEARLVGGCVRDAFLGIETADIDVAVNVPPEQSKYILEHAGIKVIPTGIDHGTITAILNKIPFQITSLRQDWQTFGRHAKVIFGTDWLEDAKRRDFTMNAMYLDEDDHLYDPFNGKENLEKGIVRFIGEPSERIKEDYLRILRYYRFLAYYGKDLPEPIIELSSLKEGLLMLSKERIQNEFFKLLSAKDPRPSLSLMRQDGVLETLFGSFFCLEKLFAIIERETLFELRPGLFRRLNALFGINSNVYAKSLCLSRQQKQYLNQLDKALGCSDRRYVYYYFGSDVFLDWILLSSIEKNFSIPDFQSKMKWIAELERPSFPLKGEDLLAAGFAPGPSLGETLKMGEIWWIEHDFKPDKETCLAHCLSKQVIQALE